MREAMIQPRDPRSEYQKKYEKSVNTIKGVLIILGAACLGLLLSPAVNKAFEELGKVNPLIK